MTNAQIGNAIKINLPAPSTMLIDAVQSYADSYACDPDNKRWLDEFHGNKFNSVLHYFGNPDFLTQLIKDEFQSFFPHHEISGLMGIMKNTQDTPACLPPHCDRSRAIGLNYFITLGGNDVKTMFYDRVEPIVGVATNILYTEVNPIEQYVFKQDWYCYNVNRCHSVENIESTRLFIAIKLVRLDRDPNQDIRGNLSDFGYTLNDFQVDYPHLCTYI
jgi:hypothetical protein